MSSARRKTRGSRRPGSAVSLPKVSRCIDASLLSDAVGSIVELWEIQYQSRQRQAEPVATVPVEKAVRNSDMPPFSWRITRESTLSLPLQSQSWA